jgi:hypothetical protein
LLGKREYFLLMAAFCQALEQQGRDLAFQFANGPTLLNGLDFVETSSVVVLHPDEHK